MILTITPTPAIDLTYTVGGLVVGDQMRASRVIKEASGKAYNVSFDLAQQGFATRAVVALSDDAVGAAWSALAADSGFGVDAVIVSAGTRINTTVRDDQGTTTRVNEPVGVLTEADVTALVGSVDEAAARGPVDWVVCSGSLPEASAKALLDGLVEAAHRIGARLAVDTSGPGLQLAAESGVDLLKPNEDELASLVGHALSDLDEVRQATAELASRTGAIVLTTLGADGAVVSDGTSTHAIATEPVSVANTAGAGDATLAGFLACSLTDDSLMTQAVEAVRWGMAACMHEGTAGLHPAAFLLSATGTATVVGNSGASSTTGSTQAESAQQWR